jgi:hypothetical protein
VPNSARLVGGAGTKSSFTGYQEDQQQTDGTTKWNSVVVCTGANACGKVSRMDMDVPYIELADSPLQSVYLKQAPRPTFVKNDMLLTQFSDCHHSAHEPDRMVSVPALFCAHLTFLAASCLRSLLHSALWIRSSRGYKPGSRYPK